jgi:hypothetical protein
MKSSRTSTKSKYLDKAKKSSQVQKKTRDSTPPGVLNADQIARFKTTQEDIAELPVESIQPCPIIPDYRKPTESTLPIVVHSPAGCYCIEGSNLIEQAKVASQPAIRCSIIKIQEHSDTELAIRKVEVRTKPRGGTCTYAELVRNTSILAKILMEEIENPVVFSHGGARQGANFTNNKEDDLRQVLSDRLGKNRSTINDNLNFGRCLTYEAKDTLVAQNTGKAFFEKVRVNKRTLIKNLESDGKTPEDITEEVSRKILEWLLEFQQTGEIKPDLGEPEQTEEDDETDDQGNETLADVGVTSAREVETFRHRSPPAEIEIPDLPTEESVKTAIQGIIEALSGLMDQSPIACDQNIEIVGNQIGQLAIAHQMLIDIRNRAENSQIKEAA